MIYVVVVGCIVAIAVMVARSRKDTAKIAELMRYSLTPEQRARYDAQAQQRYQAELAQWQRKRRGRALVIAICAGMIAVLGFAATMGGRHP